MKILLIPSWYPTEKNKITGSFFQEQAALMVEHGYDIEILYLPNKKINKSSAFWFIVKNLINGQFYKYIKLQPAAPRRLLEMVFVLTDWLKLFLKCQEYNASYETLLSGNWEPDLIHAQSIVDGGIIAYFLGKKYNKPYAVIEHNVFLLHTLAPYKQRLVLQVLKEARKVGVVSEHQKKMVLMHQPHCAPVVIWNYANEEIFTLKRNTTEPFTIITVTYSAPIKDYLTFLFTLKELKNLGHDFRFIIVGIDLTIKEIKTFVMESGLDKVGTFIPSLGRGEIGAMYHKSDIFVSTSIAETFGVAAREAMLCGLPVVTTACGGIEDSITENTGITVPIRDYQKLADAIIEIMNKERIYSPVDIRNFVINQCGKSAFVEKMKTFYTL